MENTKFNLSLIYKDYSNIFFEGTILYNENELNKAVEVYIKNSEGRKTYCSCENINEINKFKVIFFVPINDINNYNFYISIDKKEYLLSLHDFDNNPYVQEKEPFNLYIDKKVITIKDNRVYIGDTNIIDRIVYEFKRWTYIIVKYRYFPVYRIFNKKNKKYWLFNDLPEFCNDNSQAMFEYIGKNNKAIMKNAFYIVGKNYSKKNELKKIGKIIISHSINHKIKYINSKNVISSHVNFYNPFNKKETRIYKDIINNKFIFLQHGVIINDVSRILNKYKNNVRLFITSTKDEYKEVLKSKYMYSEKDVVLTGLPRFDKLNDNNNGTIVVSMTWRSSLSKAVKEFGNKEAEYIFKESEYYKKCISIISDKKIIKNLKLKNRKLIFLLHPVFKNYINLFKSYENEVIMVKSADEIVYSQIFNNLDLLITDYSSIIFDVAYLKKPVLMIQDDKKEFYENHYKKGYFSYSNDAFGDVIYTLDKLKQRIIDYIINNKEIDLKYIKKIENTFQYIDKNNCKRVYDEIMKLQ